MSGDANAANLLASLNEDCLDELLARCSAQDMLSLANTCKGLARAVSTSDKPWRTRLAADFGLHLKTLPGGTSGSAPTVPALARQVYEARGRPLRFQAALVTGGVDGDELRYWADNMFMPAAQHRYYCSNCSANADCVALLLDCAVAREEKYKEALQYIRRRCRYGAAVIANQDNPEQAMEDEDVLFLVDRWDDEEVERFFQGLVQLLNDHQHWGRLLLSDVPPARQPEELQRIQAASQFLRDRLPRMRQEMLKQPKGNIWFDASLMPKLEKPECQRYAAVIQELTLSRAGMLTCPVSAGAVIAGTVNYARLQGCSAAQAAEMLHASTLDPGCAALNSLQTLDAVKEAVAQGMLPAIAASGSAMAGQWVEFQRPAEVHASRSGAVAPSLISWAPIVWFRFHTAADVEQLVHGGGGADEASMGSSASEEEGSSEAEADETDDDDDSEGEEPADEGAAVALLQDMLAMADEEEESDEEGEDEDDGNDAEMLFMQDHTAGRQLLTVPLTLPRGANALCIKLINQENLMEESDPHDWPNIDINHVSPGGKLVRLPSNVCLDS